MNPNQDDLRIRSKFDVDRADRLIEMGYPGVASALSTLEFGVAECVKHFGEFHRLSKTESLDGFRYRVASRVTQSTNPKS